jgi:hypothetical protein
MLDAEEGGRGGRGKAAWAEDLGNVGVNDSVVIITNV